MENLKELALDIMEAACETDEVREDLDLDLFEAGLIDSLAAVVVLVELEERTGIKLQPTDMEREDISTVNHFIDFLEKKVG
ncbi:D-alanine--poly(phosphoribitol) ligase subunit DltC [Mediterraneibacter agrestimuris]|uniref:D-alanine--poly(phosphoribitol) ligase subunit DltC n=1 Tax=Mediterraneibacter agrestimuris TaxID=2941333 RepID=UPI0020420D17|nr:D-alanine--poly(phosphoribitol) ligase subunit DltC [Mediterraneibacter agrestimuris]